MNEDKSAWKTSRDIGSFLFGRRDNDVKVDIDGVFVPVADVYYNAAADAYVIELIDGEDFKTVMGR